MQGTQQRPLVSLTESEIESIVIQLQLGIAERLGMGRADHDLERFHASAPEEPAERVARARALSLLVEATYGRDRQCGLPISARVTSRLFGLDVERTLGQVNSSRTAEQCHRLIVGIERFAGFKRLHVDAPTKPTKQPLALNNLEVAELAITRCELGTSHDASWSAIQFLDDHSRSRFLVANHHATRIRGDQARGFADSYYQRWESLNRRDGLALERRRRHANA